MTDPDPVQERIKAKLEILREAWEKQWQRSDTLDSKATSIIQISGTITALIFGFVTFSQSTTQFNFSILLQGLIVASIFFGLGSIILSIVVLRTRIFYFPVDPDRYFHDKDFKLERGLNSKSISFDIEEIRGDWNYESIFKHYLISLKSFLRNSKSKSRWVFVAIIFLCLSVSLTVAAIVAIFSQQSSDTQTGNAELICKEITASSTKIVRNNSLVNSDVNNPNILICLEG